MQVDQITKMVYGQKNFWKCYLMDFLSVLGILDSKQVDVFIYIVENTNQSNNIFLGTYNKIAQDVGVCRQTIATIMKKLQEHNFIKKLQSVTSTQQQRMQKNSALKTVKSFLFKFRLQTAEISPSVMLL